MHRLLICDNDQSESYFITYVLTNIGWEVLSYSDYDDIINQVDKFKPSVIIVDNDKTKNTGIHTIKTLKNNPQTQYIPVIFVSSDINIDSLAKQSEADFYLRKPFDIKKLENLVLQASKSR
jgi:CheY-like chemotaxis protein